MILTLKGYDKDEGTGLQMFSGPGKRTVSQYLAFDQANKHHDDGLKVIDSDEENEASAIELHEDRKTLIAREI
jgi:hypothetical protein